MLPLSLLRTATNHPMLIELKNGDTYNGHLVSVDNWMNVNLKEVICTSRDGTFCCQTCLTFYVTAAGLALARLALNSSPACVRCCKWRRCGRC